LAGYRTMTRGALVPALALLVLGMLISGSTVTEDVAAATGVLRDFTVGKGNVTINFTKDSARTDYSIRLPKESNVLDASLTLKGSDFLKTNNNRSISSSSDWRAGIFSKEGDNAQLIYDTEGLHLDMATLAPFSPEKTKAAGSMVNGVATGDFNKDGRMDVVCANTDSNTVSVFTQSAAGDLVKGTDMATSSGPQDVETGDLNFDGRTDFAVGCSGGYIDIFTSKSTGGFNTKTTINTGRNVLDLDVGDLNNDARDDIAIAGYNQQGMMYTQDTSGNFTKSFDTTVNSGGYYYYTYYVRGVAIGDFNRDGRNDVVWTLSVSYTYDYVGYGFIRIHLQSASGTFSTSYTWVYWAYTYAQGVDAGDVTGDGRDDIVFANYYSSKLRAYYQVSSGGFTGPYSCSGITNPTRPRIADFDGDGMKDVIVGGIGKKFGFVRQQDNELVSTAKVWDTADQIQATAAGDMNGDGSIDAITANKDAKRIGIWLQRKEYSGSWVSSPAITQPLLIRFINFTLNIVRNGGDTRVSFSTDGGLNWTLITNGTTYDLVNRTTSFALKVTTYTTSAAKYDRVRSINLNMTYQTYPADLILDFGDDKRPEWYHGGELIGAAQLGAAQLAKPLTDYVTNGTHNPDAEGFVTIPLSIYSSTPGSLAIYDLDILYNNASRPALILQPADNGFANATPTFKFSSNDSDDDLLFYRVQITKTDFMDTFNTMTFDMATSLYDEEEGEGFACATFRQGTVGSFRLPEKFKLEDNVVYRWRVHAFDMYLWSRSSRVCTIKIDTISPIGHANSPKYSTSLNFTVSWMAEDQMPGSGLAPVGTYDVQYRRSIEVGWTEWFKGTTLTSATFTGEEGAVYFFRMRARDAVWNEQLFIGGKGDTQTTVDTRVPTVSWADMSNFQTSRSFVLRWLGSDHSPGTGIKEYEVQVRKETGDWMGWLSEWRSSQAVYTADSDTSYAFRARALDNAQNQGPWTDEFAVRIDATVPILLKEPRVPLAGEVWESLDALTVAISYADPESGMEGVEVGIGTESQMYDLLTPTYLAYPTDDRLLVEGIAFTNSQVYTVGVRAMNKAGAWTEWSWSEEFMVAIPGPGSAISYPRGTVVDPFVTINITTTDPRGYNVTLGDLRARYATRIADEWAWSEWERVSNARTDLEFETQRGFRYQFMFRAQNELGSWGPFWTPGEEDWFFVNNPPVANGGDSKVASSGRDVQFSADASSDRDGDSLSYTWDFGDGETAEGLYVSHRYSGSGLYTVTLTVSDGSGTSVARTTVYVEKEEKAPGAGAAATAIGLLAAAGAASAAAGRRRPGAVR